MTIEDCSAIKRARIVRQPMKRSKRPTYFALRIYALMLIDTAAAADADFGQRLFDRCLPCHTVAEDAPHSLGPNLFGVVDRMAGTAEGYVYSPAMANAGITWTPENLARFLKDLNGSSPDSFIPGNRMLQLGIATDDQIVDMIAYMQTLR
jgi:cytochrome c2